MYDFYPPQIKSIIIIIIIINTQLAWLTVFMATMHLKNYKKHSSLTHDYLRH